MRSNPTEFLSSLSGASSKRCVERRERDLAPLLKNSARFGIPYQSKSRHSAFLLFLLPFLFFSCQKSRTVTPTFYHWQTQFNLTDTEKTTLQTLHIDTLYAKYFDVDWKEKAVPMARIQLPDVPPQQVLIPTIFITNRTFLNLSTADIPELKANILQTIFHLHRGPEIPEIQIDCDWSSKTRDKYFALLKALRSDLKKRNIRLSATIRLHQYKYPAKTGVPPVDRGMLMLYNVGDVTDPATTNSILDLETAFSYLEPKRSYALPLDVALPIFSWGVLIRRGKMIRLLNNLRFAEMEGDSRFQKVDENRMKVLESHYFHGQYLYAGDLIRTESVPVADLEQLTEKLAELLPASPLRVAFYHLDTQTLQHYDSNTLDRLYHAFD